MCNKQTVLKITGKVNDIVCVKDKTVKYNPYRLYIVFPAKDKYGYPTTHRKQIVQYTDMNSIICHIRDMYLYGKFETRGTDYILEWNRQYIGQKERTIEYEFPR